MLLYLRTELKQLWEQNGRLYITESAFNSCYKKIRDWINIDNLLGHLMSNGLVTTGDIDEVSNPHLSNATRKTNLLKLTKSNGGRHGFFILYKCLRDSRIEVPHGHGDAVDELEAYGMQPIYIITFVKHLYFLYIYIIFSRLLYNYIS